MNPENTNNRIFAAALTITTSLGGPEALVKPCSNIIYPDQDNNNTLNIGAPTNIIEEAGFQLGPEQGAGPEQETESQFLIKINSWNIDENSTFKDLEDGPVVNLSVDQIEELSENPSYRGVILDQLFHSRFLTDTYGLDGAEINVNTALFIKDGRMHAGAFLTWIHNDNEGVSFQNPQAELRVYTLRDGEQFGVTFTPDEQFVPVYQTGQSTLQLTQGPEGFGETNDNIRVPVNTFPQFITALNTVNIRENPDTSSTVIGSITSGNKNIVLGKVNVPNWDEPWYAVETDNNLADEIDKGFVFSGVSTQSPERIEDPQAEQTLPTPVPENILAKHSIVLPEYSPGDLRMTERGIQTRVIDTIGTNNMGTITTEVITSENWNNRRYPARYEGFLDSAIENGDIERGMREFWIQALTRFGGSTREYVPWWPEGRDTVLTREEAEQMLDDRKNWPEIILPIQVVNDYSGPSIAHAESIRYYTESHPDASEIQFIDIRKGMSFIQMSDLTKHQVGENGNRRWMGPQIWGEIDNQTFPAAAMAARVSESEAIFNSDGSLDRVVSAGRLELYSFVASGFTNYQWDTADVPYYFDSWLIINMAETIKQINRSPRITPTNRSDDPIAEILSGAFTGFSSTNDLYYAMRDGTVPGIIDITSP